jgi:hypothetical protein
VDRPGFLFQWGVKKSLELLLRGNSDPRGWGRRSVPKVVLRQSFVHAEQQPLAPLVNDPVATLSGRR